MSDNIVAQRIKAARENLGITMAEASRRLNLSKIGYCRYEYGERMPSVQTIELIAQCFHTSADYLLGHADDAAPDKLVVEKQKEPALYDMIQELRENQDLMKRLLAYYHQLHC